MTDITSDYNVVLDSVSSGILVLEPIYSNTGTIDDFCICYTNSEYTSLCKGRIRSGQKISDLAHTYVYSIDFFSICAGVIADNKPYTSSYYSPAVQTYVYMTARRGSPESGPAFCILTVTDLSVLSSSGIPPVYTKPDEQFDRRVIMQKQLLLAADEKKFELVYQPQYTIGSKRLRGFEVLLRWSDSIFGQVPPDDFIPLAEETHAIISIGHWLLDSAVRTLAHWQKEFRFDGILSVNLSPVQLEEPDFSEKLFHLIKKYGIRPDSLELEVTEGIFIHNIEKTGSLFKSITGHGIRIALDDFGTGYSSFRYLQSIPVSTIKIDKSFVSGIGTENTKDPVIVSTVISLASKLGLETIAEGVEQETQIAELQSLGCTTVQGFLYGEPVNQSESEKLFISN